MANQATLDEIDRLVRLRGLELREVHISPSPQQLHQIEMRKLRYRNQLRRTVDLPALIRPVQSSPLAENSQRPLLSAHKSIPRFEVEKV